MSSVSTSKVTRSWNAWEQSFLVADGSRDVVSEKRTAGSLIATVFVGFSWEFYDLIRFCPREQLKNDSSIYHLRLDEKLNKLEDRDRDTGHVSTTK